jgi:hypothetical protein
VGLRKNTRISSEDGLYADRVSNQICPQYEREGLPLELIPATFPHFDSCSFPFSQFLSTLASIFVRIPRVSFPPPSFASFYSCPLIPTFLFLFFFTAVRHLMYCCHFPLVTCHLSRFLLVPYISLSGPSVVFVSLPKRS